MNSLACEQPGFFLFGPDRNILINKHKYIEIKKLVKTGLFKIA